MFKKKKKELVEETLVEEKKKSKAMIELEKMEDELEEKEEKKQKKYKLLLIPVIIILLISIAFIGSTGIRYDNNCRKILKKYITEKYKADIKKISVTKMTQDKREFPEILYDSITYQITDSKNKTYKVVLTLYENDVKKIVKRLNKIDINTIDICDFRAKKEVCNFK